MLQCLTEIIGVTQSDCECIINGLTSDQLTGLRASKSGLFMDDLEGGVHLKALTEIDACKSMAVLATTARDNAIKRLGDDLVVAINNRYKKGKGNFVGPIGRMSFAQSLPILRQWQGVRLRPKEYTDGIVTLTKLQVIFNQSVSVTLRLYKVPMDSVMGEEVAAWPVTSAANAYVNVTLSAPVKMPLVENGELMEYYILYDTLEPGVAFLPKDNGILCTTCNRGIVPYGDFISADGVQVNNLSTLNDKIVDKYTHGLILDVAVKCDNEKLFCREYDESDDVAVVMAYATRFKAGELLIEDVLKSPAVNRYTTMGREYLWGKRNHFKSEYDDRIAYLAKIIDVTQANCYVCRESPNQPFLAGIKA
jgi:hypothetical protein